MECHYLWIYYLGNNQSLDVSPNMVQFFYNNSLFPIPHSLLPTPYSRFMLGIHCPCEMSLGEGGEGMFSDDEMALISEAVWPNRSAR
jgi:hypothetical protein